MEYENNTWIMHGVSRDAPDCLHTVEEAIEYIESTGFLPLFRNEIPGFSLEEHTVPEYWWSDDSEVDPWKWREIIAGSGRAAYGKFFNQKAGFISREWLPQFVNFRRDGYDFDSLWEDGKASGRQKKIMDLFAEEHADEEYFSYEIKQKAGFGKGGDRGFEGIVTGLQMQMYLCVRDFRQRRNKKGEEYGWSIARYCLPEHLWGYDYVTSAYKEEPTESGERILRQLTAKYSAAGTRAVHRMIGIKTGSKR